MVIHSSAETTRKIKIEKFITQKSWRIDSTLRGATQGVSADSKRQDLGACLP